MLLVITIIPDKKNLKDNAKPFKQAVKPLKISRKSKGTKILYLNSKKFVICSSIIFEFVCTKNRNLLMNQKKFGAFAGVFTPSILTILGVIMYLRLGWVVGQAGLIAAIAIIIVAHVISITTGLSITAISTDKKIKAGGLYYMLSRSLGLPMGGAIGITLFVGTALSISLYLVGFTESVFAIEGIRNFLGLEGSIDDIRIVGSIILIFLVILAFISTSLAIKTQLIIFYFDVTKKGITTRSSRKSIFLKKKGSPPFNIPVPQNYVSIGHWVILFFTMGKR